MSRVQLALNVDDLDTAIGFCSKLFDTAPAKVREGHANFAITEPPLKLVLIENPTNGGTLNHLGVEVDDTSQVTAATARLSSEGLDTDIEDNTTCCYAVQDKVWVQGMGTRSRRRAVGDLHGARRRRTDARGTHRRW